MAQIHLGHRSSTVGPPIEVTQYPNFLMANDTEITKANRV